ncbi:MAG: hypothetical protein QNJ68_15855 [Microcoleaceae cyanobacterium MO_207.B10]|nr:hypothetical protein [Microcoleaceae cyanobacterium MO_207.B10]
MNDGLLGYDIFTIPEFERELPLATGITKIEEFLTSLYKKGYCGPIAIEPWNQTIQNMPLEDAIKAVKESFDKALALINISND